MTTVSRRPGMVALQRQRSEPIVRIEGREYDITNLFPISETRNMVGRRGYSCREISMERSLYPAKEDLLKSVAEIDAFRGSTTGSARDLERWGSRRYQPAKAEESLYPRISPLDRSLDPEDAEVIFRKYPRRKTVTHTSSQSTEMLNFSLTKSSSYRSDLAGKDAKLPPMSSSLRPKAILGSDQDGNPEASVEFITRVRQPPRSYSVTSNRGSGDQCEAANKMDLSSAHSIQRRQSKSRSFVAIGDNRTLPEETMATTTERNDRNESLQLRQTTRTKYTPCPPSCLVEVATGIVMELRGAAETLHAIESGIATSVTCACCQVPLLCVPDVECVICPDCKVVSPVYNPCATNESRGGVGLGMKSLPAQD